MQVIRKGKDAAMKLEVRVQPRSSKNAVMRMEDGRLKIKLKAAPVDGEANQELIAFLAGLLKIPKRDISIASGSASRSKILSIEGLTEAEFLQRCSL